MLQEACNNPEYITQLNCATCGLNYWTKETGTLGAYWVTLRGFMSVFGIVMMGTIGSGSVACLKMYAKQRRNWIWLLLRGKRGRWCRVAQGGHWILCICLSSFGCWSVRHTGVGRKLGECVLILFRWRFGHTDFWILIVMKIGYYIPSIKACGTQVPQNTVFKWTRTQLPGGESGVQLKWNAP